MADPPDRDAAGCAFVGPCQAGRWISAARVLREATLRGQHGVGGATGAATPTAGDRWVHLPAAAFDHRRLCDPMGALDGSAPASSCRGWGLNTTLCPLVGPFASGPKLSGASRRQPAAIQSETG